MLQQWMVGSLSLASSTKPLSLRGEVWSQLPSSVSSGALYRNRTSSRSWLEQQAWRWSSTYGPTLQSTPSSTGTPSGRETRGTHERICSTPLDHVDTPNGRPWPPWPEQWSPQTPARCLSPLAHDIVFSSLSPTSFLSSASHSITCTSLWNPRPSFDLPGGGKLSPPSGKIVGIILVTLRAQAKAYNKFHTKCQAKAKKRRKEQFKMNVNNLPSLWPLVRWWPTGHRERLIKHDLKIGWASPLKDQTSGSWCPRESTRRRFHDILIGHQATPLRVTQGMAP